MAGGVPSIEKGVQNVGLTRTFPSSMRFKPGPHQRFQQAANLGGGLAAAPCIPRQHQPARTIHGRQHQAWRQRLKTRKSRKNPVRIHAFQRHGKDGAKNDVGSDVRHLYFNIVFGSIRQRTQARQHGLHRLAHHRKSHIDTRLGKCGLHHGALALPLFPVGRENAVTQQGPQGLAQQFTLGEIAGFFGQHPINQSRLVHHVQVQARQMHLAHLHAIAAFVQAVQP